MRMRPVFLATSLITFAVPILFAAGAASAQLPDTAPVVFRLAPGLIDGASTTLGLRYALGAAPRVEYGMSSKFATKRSWQAKLDGALAVESAAVTEPLARGVVDLGARVLLRNVAACTSERCVPGEVGWDYGYAMLGVRVAGEVGQRADEIDGAAGVSLLYRPPPLATGLWPAVPAVVLDYLIVQPVRSQLVEAAGEVLETKRRFDVALLWHARLGHDGVPDAISRLRLEAEWRRFEEFGRSEVEQALSSAAGEFVALGLGYDMTGRTRWMREVFVRWSEGENPTQKQERRAWFIGISLGLD